jgi:hypothetical protein
LNVGFAFRGGLLLILLLLMSCDFFLCLAAVLEPPPRRESASRYRHLQKAVAIPPACIERSKAVAIVRKEHIKAIQGVKSHAVSTLLLSLHGGRVLFLLPPVRNEVNWYCATVATA